MDSDQVAACLVEAALAVPAIDMAAVLRLDAATDSFEIVSWSETRSHADRLPAEPMGEEAQRTRIALTHAPLERAALARGAASSDDLGAAAVSLQGSPQANTALAVRIGTESEPFGVLRVERSTPGRVDALQVALLRHLAEMGSIAFIALQGMSRLQEIEAGKAQFIRVATHELRSPVTVTQSLVRTILKGYAGTLTERQRDIFGRVSGQLDALEGLVNDLLDLASSRSPALAEEAQPVSLFASVARVVLVLQPAAESKGVELSLDACREELPVRATEEGLDRIFSNLVGNAVKYTPTGGRVVVSVCVAGSGVEVTITDTGIGIPAESLTLLFEEFYRAPNARAAAVGTGIGLSIVKTLVDRYRGRISVTSTVGEGTTFTVHFPLHAGTSM